MASIRQRGPSWEAKVRREGRSLYATFKTKEAAENWAAKAESEIRYQSMLRETGPTVDAILKASDAARFSSAYVSGSGVYILFHGYHVVYVGQSKCVMTRLQQHAKNGRPFDRYVVIPCDASELDAAERELIRRLSPPGNIQLRQESGNTLETRASA